MLGPTQEAWLAKEFEAAANHAVTWTVLGNQTALADLTVTLGREAITLFDQWDGYPALAGAYSTQPAGRGWPTWWPPLATCIAPSPLTW